MSEPSTQHSVSYHIAHVVRIITIPPVMVAALIVLLYNLRPGHVFASLTEMIAALAFLTIVPILAYPVSMIVPSIRKKGRDGQRSLAIYFSAVGYVAGFAYGLAAHVGDPLMLIFLAYLLSVLILLVLNKVFHVRASGHACSVAGPLVFSAYFLGLWGLIVGVVFWGVIFWASITMKRHTVKEFLLGTATCLVSFGTSLIFFH